MAALHESIVSYERALFLPAKFSVNKFAGFGNISSKMQFCLSFIALQLKFSNCFRIQLSFFFTVTELNGKGPSIMNFYRPIFPIFRISPKMNASIGFQLCIHSRANISNVANID